MTLADLAALLLAPRNPRNARTQYVGRHRAPDMNRFVASVSMAGLVPPKQA